MAVTLITGASSGIGRQLARRLAARGDAVALAARRIDLLESVAGEIRGEGGSAIAVACDVMDRAQVAAAVLRAESSFGPMERLICNAGGGEKTGVIKLSR